VEILCAGAEKKYFGAQFSNAAPGIEPGRESNLLFDDNFELRGHAVDQLTVTIDSPQS